LKPQGIGSDTMAARQERGIFSGLFGN